MVNKLNKIKFLRLRKGITQFELANELGIKESYLSRIETGKNNLKLVYAIIIAAYFNVDVDYVFEPLTDNDIKSL